MSILHTWAKYWRSTVGPLILAFAVAMVVGGVAPKPAFSQGHERHSWRQERGRQVREWRRENRREWRRENRQEWREAHRWRGRAPYGYYAPPPGVYAPAPSPGINLFFHIP